MHHFAQNLPDYHQLIFRIIQSNVTREITFNNKTIVGKIQLNTADFSSFAVIETIGNLLRSLQQKNPLEIDFNNISPSKKARLAEIKNSAHSTKVLICLNRASIIGCDLIIFGSCDDDSSGTKNIRAQSLYRNLDELIKRLFTRRKESEIEKFEDFVVSRDANYRMNLVRGAVFAMVTHAIALVMHCRRVTAGTCHHRRPTYSSLRYFLPIRKYINI